MATQYACIELNNRKFRLAYYKSYSNHLPKQVALIDFENSVKYINTDCPLDVVNSKVVKKIGFGLVSVKISDEAQDEITLTIGSCKNTLKMMRAEITNEDLLQEQLNLMEKRFQNMMEEFQKQFKIMHEEILSLKAKNEEIESLKIKNEENLQKIENLATDLSNTNTTVTQLTTNPCIVERNIPVTINYSFPYSKILTSNEQAVFLNESIGKSHQRWTLIHQGSIHGFTTATIQENILYRGPFIILVKSTKNYIFGGFNSVGLKGGNVYRHAYGCFLFSLVRNRVETDCKKLNMIPNKTDSFYDGINNQPCIFGNHDLYIADNCNNNTTSHSQLDSYESEHRYYLAGERNFQVLELEFYIPNLATY